jgi:hypothetical protein
MKKGKKRQVLKNRNYVFLVALLALLVFLIIVFSVGITQRNRHGVAIEDLSFKDVSGRSVMAFSLVNRDTLPADCVASLFINGKKSVYALGIVKPQSKKNVTAIVSMPNGKSDYKLEPLCQWKPFDTTGCERTNFRICELTRKDSRLKQCLTGTISDQYLCIAVLRANSSFCEYINPNDKRTKCKAFVGNNPAPCAELSQTARDACYEDYGMNKQNQTVCELIQSSDKKQACLGVATQDPSLCEDINEDDKLLCVLNLAEFMGDETLCDMMQNADSCYEKIAWMKPSFGTT